MQIVLFIINNMDDLIQILCYNLSKLDCTINSIKNTSEIFMKLALEHESINELLKLWKKYFIINNDKLAFIYLMSEIVHISKYHNFDFHMKFYKTLIEVIPYLRNIENMKNHMNEIINVWSDGNIYNIELLDNIKRLLFTSNNEMLTNSNIVSNIFNKNTSIPIKLKELVYLLEKLEMYKSFTNESFEYGKEKLINDENKYRGDLLISLVDFIKLQNVYYTNHLNYLKEIDNILDNINNKKFNIYY